jgi:hypothetical protein
VGDSIELVEQLTGSPTKYQGDITSVNGNTIRVVLDSAISGLDTAVSGGTYNLKFDDASGATARQLTFCFVADSSRQLADGSPARVFGA